MICQTVHLGNATNFDSTFDFVSCWARIYTASIKNSTKKAPIEHVHPMAGTAWSQFCQQLMFVSKEEYLFSLTMSLIGNVNIKNIY